jgi:hypothetical protein
VALFYKSWHSTEYDYSWAMRLTGTVFSCHFCWLS